jgi:hypothetical protein
MKKIIIFTIMTTIFIGSIEANNRRDSIYNDLFTFLYDDGAISKGMNIKQEDYKHYLFIFDILTGKSASNFLNSDFGVYKFNYAGNIDGGYYVLIVYNKTYKVYWQSNLKLILSNLMEIRSENSKTLSDNLFYRYLESLLDDQAGMYEEELVLFKKFGKITYYYSR